MSEPNWLLRSVVVAMHDMQLAEHGGAPGLRDEGLLESALAAPVNAFAYGESDICALAAAYAHAILRNHPFMDGNKRTAFLAAFVFLRINGLNLIADEVSVVTNILTAAAGDSDQRDLARWLRAHTERVDKAGGA